ncbi:hypothetical protein [Nocardia neocaledoniensis]|uniref:hypothetical protein n=1 Tax=Nocardia neocaledoniensis TaxID=236511 RepID=UPI00245647D7|nr:hypothetical protein [Nocardia neocaledoniensis]
MQSAVPTSFRLMVRASPSGGAPRSFRARAEPADPGPDYLIAAGSRDLLNFFDACPRCGYPAQAREITRIFYSGDVQRFLFLACGLPCGWAETQPISQDGAAF